MALRFHSVGSKLLWSVALPGLLVTLLGAAGFWREARESAWEDTREEALGLAELVAGSFREPVPAPDSAHAPVESVLTGHSRLMNGVKELRVLSLEGTVLWSRQPGERGTRPADAARLLEAARTPQVQRWGDGGAEVVSGLGGEVCVSCHPQARGGSVGVLHLRLAPSAPHRQLIGVLGAAITAVLALGLLLVVATALSLHFVLARPLRRLTAAMRRAEEGDLLVRAEVKGADEIARLSAAFNAMLAHLTAMKAEEIDTHRDLAETKHKLSLKEELEVRVSELNLLFEVARSLNSTIELHELLSRLTRVVPERLRIPDFSIMLLTPEGQLEIKSAWPVSQGTEGLTFNVGEGACGRAAETQRVVYVPDVTDPSSVFARPGLRPGKDVGALLSVPMIHLDQVLGVLNFQRPEPDSFSPDEIELLMAVADQVATAVQNARLHAETVKLTMTDPLTGVPNRRHLFARLELEVARAQRFGTTVSILMVDIDHFKRLNDAAGHRVGDEMLRKVCEVLRTRVRKVDTLARYGGEEFMLVLPQVTKADAYGVAEKLRQAIEEAPQLVAPTQPSGHITVSIGVANMPADATSQELLVDCADAALYGSKRLGRNRTTLYEPGMEVHPGRERGISRSEPAPSMAKA